MDIAYLRSKGYKSSRPDYVWREPRPERVISRKPRRVFKTSEKIRYINRNRRSQKVRALERDNNKCRCCGWSPQKRESRYTDYPASCIYSFKQKKNIIMAQHGRWETTIHWDDSRRLEVHHIIPLSNGGGDGLANLITLCSSCHKSTKTNHYRERFKK